MSHNFLFNKPSSGFWSVTNSNGQPKRKSRFQKYMRGPSSLTAVGNNIQ